MSDWFSMTVKCSYLTRNRLRRESIFCVCLNCSTVWRQIKMQILEQTMYCDCWTVQKHTKSTVNVLFDCFRITRYQRLVIIWLTASVWNQENICMLLLYFVILTRFSKNTKKWYRFRKIYPKNEKSYLWNHSESNGEASDKISY